jgi:formamidopyrimidine-DNA glycosylase
MLFRLGKKWDAEKPFSAMGPEPLNDDFTGRVLAEKIARKKGPIKTVLLDQSVVAGVGNIYACEALYHAGIDPLKKANEVLAEKTVKLVSAVQHVLNLAIEAGGSTLRDHRKTNGSKGYFQHNFSVYDREGKACPGCDCNIAKTGGIRRIVQAGRSTFYCPRKQK